MLQQALFSGFGGQGVLLMGQLVAQAGMAEGKHVSWLPSYGPEMRGGTANCSVVVSLRPIASPVITSATCVVAMNRPSLEKFQSTVRTGGALLVNSSLVDVAAARQDIQTYEIPASQIAEELGSPRAANMVMLGAFMEVTRCVAPEQVLLALTGKLGLKKAHLMEINRLALEAGARAVRPAG